jgi:hypothetical protein
MLKSRKTSEQGISGQFGVVLIDYNYCITIQSQNTVYKWRINASATTSYMAEIMYISCLCATPEGSTPPSFLANDYLMLPTLLFFVILADGALQNTR